jgi:wyosine [tRNA(Phe)-imidazoG37] synthetase (radical SAM superfamily)
VNRPAPGIHFEDFLSGLKVFRRHYRGVFWVEVFLVPGLNSVPADVSRIARITETLKPDCVHLNTAVRPPVLNFVKPLTRNRLEALTGLFDPSARIAFGHCDRDVSHRGRFTDKSIVAMISRRPCTPGQIATAFGMHRIEVSKHLERLLRSGRISRQGSGNGVYFRADVETAKKEGGGISEG